MDGLQFITSNPVRDGRRQAFGEAVARQTFEDGQADRSRAADDRANKAALDEAFRSIAAGRATGATVHDDIARSVSAIPGGGEAGLGAIQARNEAAAAQAAAQQERADLDRKRNDKLAELASDRGFSLLKLGAVAEAKAAFENAGMKFPEQFYVDRAMQARTEQALPTAKEFYGHDPQNGAKFMAAVMQGTSVEQAFQQYPPIAKPPAVTRPNLQDRTIPLSNGATATISGQVVNGVWQPVLDANGRLGIDGGVLGSDPATTAEIYRQLGLAPPPGMVQTPAQQEEPGFFSRTWDRITGGSPDTATAVPQRPTGPGPAPTGIEGINAGQPAPAPAAAPVAPVTSPNSTAPGDPVATAEGLRFPDGQVVPIGGMIYQGGKPFIIQSITVDPASGEYIVNVNPTGQ